ncbi:mannose-6-phosphate isomerase [Kitasatospora acidiphila]|uniref:Mannose-6-phosphate isomerase n=1 Tax=Kitasatospora acidiphila TaxID=2567942 RepID=A0A540W856_9ACTN|nr:SIS domain-containing protein [Kitasatospora acidiphila]TQF05178.1 mannose-6-phosphate isomerase [Kitasatospora acidiphila]
MLDDSLLDDPAALQRADQDHALLALAASGARVRTALRLAEAAGVSSLRPEGRPRAVLVAGAGSVPMVGQALAALVGGATLVHPLAAVDVLPSDPFSAGLSWQLPGWAGPLDLVVVASAEGVEEGLIRLAEQAYARGCAITVIAPEGRPLAEAAAQVRALPLPYAVATLEEPAAAPAEPDLPPEDPAALWAFLTPLLALAEKIGVLRLGPGELPALADLLDELAVRHRPDAPAYRNPAKGLAAQLAGTVPLLWSEGEPAGVAAERLAAMLADRAGRPAVTGRLPQALSTHRGMFSGQLGAGGDPEDFFRDRVEEPEPLSLELLLLRHTPRPADQGDGDGGEPETPAEPGPAGHAVRRARRLAEAHEVRLTELTAERPEPLAALAELVSLGDFAAVYLGLATRSGH